MSKLNELPAAGFMKWNLQLTRGHMKMRMPAQKGAGWATILWLLVVGCATLSPQGTGVRLTSNPEATRGCRFLGTVRANPPYGLPTDWEIKLKNQTALLGGDVVFAQPPGVQVTVNGEAYRCAGASASSTPSVPPSPSTPSVVQGTAFTVAPDGTLLTVFHLIRESRTITVLCPGQPPLAGVVHHAAPGTDLAVIRTGHPTDEYLSLAPPRSLRLGESVFTIGFPTPGLLGVEPKYADGAISALSGPSGEIELIQITVPVQPGNSGGSVVNAQGQVVGIVTSSVAVRAFLARTGTLPQNINWAVKADFAAPLFDAPPARPEVASRDEAVARVVKATCRLEGAP